MAALRNAIAARRTTMLHGDPGIGKTQMVWAQAAEAFAHVYGWKWTDGVLKDAKGKEYPFGFPHCPWYREARTATMNPEDWGLPRFDNATGRMSWAMSDVLPTDERGGIFFLDEVNRGTESTVNSCFALVDRKLHSYILPQKWLIIAAVNDKDIGARKMSSAFLSRFRHLDVRTDLDDVLKLAVERDWHPAVLAFLRFRPELLHQYEPKARTSPNPRAWEFVSNMLHAGEVMTKDVELASIAGDVGEGTASEFHGFMALYRELPSIEGILKDPSGSPVPKQTASLFAIASALARRATQKNFAAVVTYMDRLPLEYAVFGIKTAVNRDKSIVAASREFSNWCAKHKDITL
jgi:hypothetical protein